MQDRSAPCIKFGKDDYINSSCNILHDYNSHGVTFLGLPVLYIADQASNPESLAFNPLFFFTEVGIGHRQDIFPVVIQGMTGQVKAHGFFFKGKFFLVSPVRDRRDFDFSMLLFIVTVHDCKKRYLAAQFVTLGCLTLL